MKRTSGLRFLQPCIIALLVCAAFMISASSLVVAQQFSPDLFKSLRWRSIGPFRGGRTRAVSGVPSQPNVFYIAQVNGGVWKTNDYGRTWTPIFDDQPTGSVGCIAVAASDPRRWHARCSHMVRRHKVRPGPVASAGHVVGHRRGRLADHRLHACRRGGAGRGRVLQQDGQGVGRADRAALRRARGIPADRSRDRRGMADQQGARLQQGSAAVQLPADVAEDGDHRGRSEGDRLRTDRGPARGGHLTKAVPAVRLHVSEIRAAPDGRHAARVLRVLASSNCRSRHPLRRNRPGGRSQAADAEAAVSAIHQDGPVRDGRAAGRAQAPAARGPAPAEVVRSLERGRPRGIRHLVRGQLLVERLAGGPQPPGSRDSARVPAQRNPVIDSREDWEAARARFESLKKQLEFSKKQLSDLAYDLKHNNTDSIQFNKNFLAEKNIADEICKEINMLEEKSEQAIANYKTLSPAVNTIVQSLDTTVPPRFGVSAGSEGEKETDKD